MFNFHFQYLNLRQILKYIWLLDIWNLNVKTGTATNGMCKSYKPLFNIL